MNLNYQTVLAQTEVSAKAIETYLKMRGLKTSAPNRRELIKQIVKLVDSGALEPQDISEVVRDIEEHGGKEVFFRQVNDLKLLSDTDSLTQHLAENNIKVTAKPRDTYRKPINRAVFNYATIGDEKVRIRFTETHIHKKISGWKVLKNEKTKSILFVVDRKSGESLIIADHAGSYLKADGEEMPISHKEYIDQYLTKFTTYFGPSVAVSFSRALLYAYDYGGGRIESWGLTGIDDEGLPTKIFDVSADIRDTKAYKRLKDKANSSVAIWKRDESGEAYDSSFIELNPLIRDIKVIVHPPEGLMSFRTEILSQELLYVISTIRTAQERITLAQSG